MTHNAARQIYQAIEEGPPIFPAWRENQFLGGRASCPLNVISGETPDPRCLKGPGGIWPFAAFIGRPIEEQRNPFGFALSATHGDKASALRGCWMLLSADSRGAQSPLPNRRRFLRGRRRDTLLQDVAGVAMSAAWRLFWSCEI